MKKNSIAVIDIIKEKVTNTVFGATDQKEGKKLNAIFFRTKIKLSAAYSNNIVIL